MDHLVQQCRRGSPSSARPGASRRSRRRSSAPRVAGLDADEAHARAGARAARSRSRPRARRRRPGSGNVSTSGSCSASSSPIVPWPAITARPRTRGRSVAPSRRRCGAPRRARRRSPHPRARRPRRSCASRSTFAIGASCGMKIVAAIPSSRAAHATAWPWLPALAAITPAARSASPSDASLLTAPRILNEPVRCRFSALSQTVARRRAATAPPSRRRASRARGRRSGRARPRCQRASASWCPSFPMWNTFSRISCTAVSGSSSRRCTSSRSRRSSGSSVTAFSRCRSPAPTQPRTPPPPGSDGAAPRAARSASSHVRCVFDLLPQRLDALAAHRLGQHDRRLQSRSPPEREHLAHLVRASSSPAGGPPC